MQYVSPYTSVNWIVSSNCTVSSSKNNGATASITCSEVGVEPIAVYRDGSTATTDTFYITFKQSVGCHEWYFATGNTGWDKSNQGTSSLLVPANTNLTGRLWIVDPSNPSSISDITSRATAPSTVSYNFIAAPKLVSCDGPLMS